MRYAKSTNGKRASERYTNPGSADNLLIVLGQCRGNEVEQGLKSFTLHREEILQKFIISEDRREQEKVRWALGIKSLYPMLKGSTLKIEYLRTVWL